VVQQALACGLLEFNFKQQTDQCFLIQELGLLDFQTQTELLLTRQYHLQLVETFA
jgi:hypothetical protein